jgi:lysozyme family protein
MSAFDEAFSEVLSVEGGYSDHPNDRGGKTNWGITEAVARANGYTGPMEELTQGQARAIYKAQYWDTLRLNDVAALSWAVAAELFDTAVNMGVAVSGRFLQRALNALNRQGQDFPDLTVDGVVGPMTVANLKAYMSRRGVEGQKVMLRALNALQGTRYIEIAEGRPENESFVYGWFAQRVGL